MSTAATAKGCLGIVAGLVVLLVILAAVFGSDEPTGPVPDVVGMQLEDARATLDEAGFGVDEDDDSDTLDFDTDNNIVCSTSPAAGKRASGDVTVSSRSDLEDCPGQAPPADATEEPAAPEEPVDEPDDEPVPQSAGSARAACETYESGTPAGDELLDICRASYRECSRLTLAELKAKYGGDRVSVSMRRARKVYTASSLEFTNVSSARLAADVGCVAAQFEDP